MNYKTKPQKRTLITFIALSVLGLVGVILSFFLKDLIVKVLSLSVSVILLLTSIFKILLEIKFSVEINDNKFIINRLFSKKEVNISDIKLIKQSITDYTFYLDDNKKLISVDIDLKNINEIINYLKSKNIEVKVIQ